MSFDTAATKPSLAETGITTVLHKENATKKLAIFSKAPSSEAIGKSIYGTTAEDRDATVATIIAAMRPFKTSAHAFYNFAEVVCDPRRLSVLLRPIHIGGKEYTIRIPATPSSKAKPSLAECGLLSDADGVIVLYTHSLVAEGEETKETSYSIIARPSFKLNKWLESVCGDSDYKQVIAELVATNNRESISVKFPIVSGNVLELTLNDAPLFPTCFFNTLATWKPADVKIEEKKGNVIAKATQLSKRAKSLCGVDDDADEAATNDDMPPKEQQPPLKKLRPSPPSSSSPPVDVDVLDTKLQEYLSLLKPSKISPTSKFVKVHEVMAYARELVDNPKFVQLADDTVADIAAAGSYAALKGTPTAKMVTNTCRLFVALARDAFADPPEPVDEEAEFE